MLFQLLGIWIIRLIFLDVYLMFVITWTCIKVCFIFTHIYYVLYSSYGLSVSTSYSSRCCSNHLSLKDKWSHNEQSSPMGYQVKSGRITRELDKEPSLHCSSIYTTTLWSVLQQYIYLMSIHHTSTSCPITHLHVFSLRPPCFLHVPWHHIFNLRYTCAHYVYTMRNPCPLMLSLTLTLI